MAIEVLTSTNPIVSTARASAWVTKDESVTFSQIIWRTLTTVGGTLILTNGGVTTTLSNILVKREYNASAVMSVLAMNVITEPITVSRLYIHTNDQVGAGAAGGTLEFWKE